MVIPKIRARLIEAQIHIMNHMSENILQWQDYQAAESQLKEALQALDSEPSPNSDKEVSAYQQLLDANEKLITFRDQAFPLLLGNGHSLQLKFPPVSIYLLKPQRGDSHRYLLAFFYLNGGEAAVQLVRWDANADPSATRPCLLSILEDMSTCNSDEVPLPHLIPGCRHRLDRPPVNIESAKLGKTGLVQLGFAQGEFELTFDDQRGISHCTWTENRNDSNKSTETWIQRSSWGEMPVCVRLSRQWGHSWQDDQISFPSRPIQTILQVGRIRGADSLLDGRTVYLASNLGKVFSFGDKTVESKAFSHEMLDVLLVPGREEVKPWLLVAEKEGFIYLLDHELRVIHWQDLKRHIVRLIGCGTGSILAVDKNGCLIPLRLHNPDDFEEYRKGANSHLAKYLLKNADGQWQFPNARKNLESQPERLLQSAGVAVEYFFRHIDIDNAAEYHFALAGWLESLSGLYPELVEVENCNILTSMHRRFLRHALRWIVSSCYKNNPTDERIKDWRAKFPVINGQLHPSLALVFQLLSLPEQALDELWLQFLRRRDWVEAWARKTGLIEYKEFKNRLEEFQTRTAKYRTQFFPAFIELRQLNFVRSHRLVNYIRHMELLPGQKQYLAALTADRKLRIFDITKPQGSDWQVTDAMVNVPWQGQPSFVRCLTPKNESAYPMIVGTIRGELFQLEWQQEVQQVTVIRSLKADFAICCSHFIEAKHILFFGGRTRAGKACLYRWQLTQNQPNNHEPKLIWTDGNDISSLCMLRRSEDYFWAINRDKGQLLAWPYAQLCHTGKASQPEYWLEGTHKLYSLEYLNLPAPLLICGGEGGRIWCLNARDGTVRWLVHAPGDLRHVRYLARYKEHEGVCLLTCDDGSNLLVDQDGTIICIYERLGPVSALLSAEGGVPDGEKMLVMATQTGRLSVLGTLPEYTEQDLAQWIKSKPANQKALYLLRQHDSGTQNVVDLPKQPYEEALLNQICLKRIVEEIRTLPIPEQRQVQIIEFVFHEGHSNLNGLVVFLYALQGLDYSNLPNGNASFVLSLISRCWQDIQNKRRGADLWFCKLLAPIRQILDELTTSPDAQFLRQTINQQIWPKTPSHNPQIAVHRSLRLLLAVKRWLKLQDETSANNLQKLDVWCNALAMECSAGSSEELHQVIRELLSESLRLLPENDPWWPRFKLLINDEQVPDSPRPEPLTHLFPSGVETLSQPNFEAVSALFPHNRAWATWLENLQAILTSLDSNRHSSPHIAYREKGDWARLREHILVSGHDNFSVASGQALLALCWPRLCEHWEELILQGLGELERRIFDKPEDYLDVKIRVLWLSKTQAELRLQIGNRFRGTLELQGVAWNGEQLEVADLPTTLPYRPESNLKLILTTNDQHLRGELQFDCNELETNRPIVVRITDIDIPRDIAPLSIEQSWQPTWQRLLWLLDRYQTQNQGFYWLDGDVWTDRRRDQLKRDVAEKFGFISSTSSDASELEWYSPDLALGASAYTQLAQLHALLPKLPDGGMPNAWPLAFWRWAGKLPDSVVACLPIIPGDTNVEQVLRKLYGPEATTNEAISALKTTLQQLPNRAFGAWSAQQPFYVAADGENLTEDELYQPAAMLIDATLWDYLDKAPERDVADLLGLDARQLVIQRQARQQFQQYYPVLSQVQNTYSDSCDQFAQSLLRKLGDGSIDFNPGGFWRIRLHKALTLNWQDHIDCRLLPKQSVIKHAETAIISGEQLLWLCLGETQPPSLPGTVLALSEADVLALLHAQTPRDVQGWLNLRRAEQQTRVLTAEVFRSNGGMGQRVIKHFFGRREALAELKACLSNTDNASPGVECREAALLIGGRRMGKTSLRERIQYEMGTEDPDRIYWAFDFQSMPEHLHGNELERWFLLKVAEVSAKTRFPFKPDWPDGQKDNANYRDRHRQQLRSHLHVIKQKTGKTPLWTFDETDWLAKADTQQERARWQLFKFFRLLINSAEICLFATSYPHGAEQAYALNVARYDTNTPICNTFTHDVDLEPWSPQEAWTFLHSRLAGLGVILPRRYRQEFLQMTRGVIWLVHVLGEELCRALPESSRSKIIDVAVWQKAKQHSLHHLQNGLKTPVDQAGRRQDERFGVSLVQEPEASLEHLLWRSLLNLAQPLQASIGDDECWLDEPQTFTLQQLTDAMPRVKPVAVLDALKELTASPALVGDAQKRDEYRFAYNLLPTWKVLDALEREHQ